MRHQRSIGGSIIAPRAQGRGHARPRWGADVKDQKIYIIINDNHHKTLNLVHFHNNHTKKSLFHSQGRASERFYRSCLLLRVRKSKSLLRSSSSERCGS